MNSFGSLFRVSIYGESHGMGCGILVDGCPAGVPLTEADFLPDLMRRKSGARGTTPRTEADTPTLRSGVFEGKTTGAPILIAFENTNTRSRDYDVLKTVPRPGHADFTAGKKYAGFTDHRGGGHFSGRITLGLVAAGVIAKKIITPVNIRAELIEAGGDEDVRRAVEKAVDAGNSIGGIVECEILRTPVGLGEPFFESLEAVMAHMMFSIPAIKGVEFGSGFRAARMTGSEHNDCIIDVNGTTETNYAGGINGGITNGNPIIFRAAVKPTSSISLPQKTINFKTGDMTTLLVEGRHDTCVALRIPVVVENAAALVMADFMLKEQHIPRVAETE